MSKATYRNGDVYCTECRVWIFKQDMPKETWVSKNGRSHHNECGLPVRTKSRLSLEKMRRFRERHCFVLYDRNGNVIKTKRDIIENKEKIEELLLQSKKLSTT